jgi:hypothetical protein
MNPLLTNPAEFAALLQRFFTDRLCTQMEASAHTIAGYRDTFRLLHPDEVARPEGTYAVIFGHLQHGRIDYLYCRGRGLRPVASKIIRTTADIDFVWPSDHAAVLTTFDVQP